MHQVHPLVMAASLVDILSSARNTLNPSPWQDSRCKCHLSFPLSYFFAPSSSALFFNLFPPPPSPLPDCEGQILLLKAAERFVSLESPQISGEAPGNDFSSNTGVRRKVLGVAVPSSEGVGTVEQALLVRVAPLFCLPRAGGEGAWLSWCRCSLSNMCPALGRAVRRGITAPSAH